VSDRLAELEARISGGAHKLADQLRVQGDGTWAEIIVKGIDPALAELVEIVRKQETALRRIADGCVVERYDISSQTFVVTEGLDILQIARDALAVSPPESREQR
jgi:hypothetical protein